jgi:hypothetical protein
MVGLIAKLLGGFMRKNATFFCIVVMVFTLVSCGNQPSIVNDDNKITIKTDNSIKLQKDDIKTDKVTSKSLDNVKKTENSEKVLIELMTIKYMCENYLIVGKYRDERHSIGLYTEIPFFIEQSKILDKELKIKLSTPLTDLSDNNRYGDAIFQAILELEIEKLKIR